MQYIGIVPAVNRVMKLVICTVSFVTIEVYLLHVLNLALIYKEYVVYVAESCHTLLYRVTVCYIVEVVY